MRLFSPLRGAALDRVQDALAAVLNPAIGAIPSFVDAETPAGPCDAVNLTFRLSRMPAPAESLRVVLATTSTGVGSDLVQGLAYTLRRSGAGAEIEMASAPASTATIRCWYRY